MAVVLGDLELYEMAKVRFQEVTGDLRGPSDIENRYRLVSLESLALECKRKKNFGKAKELFLQLIQIRKRVQGIENQHTLNSIANMASTYRRHDSRYSDWSSDMISLTNAIKENAPISEADLIQAAGWCDEKLMTLLLELKRDNVTITEKVVEATAMNWEDEMVIKSLFDKRGDEIKVNQRLLESAFRRGRRKAMKLLIDKRVHEIKITEELVEAAVGTGSADWGKMDLVFDIPGSRITVNSRLKAKIVNNWDCPPTVKDLFREYGKKFHTSREVAWEDRNWGTLWKRESGDWALS